MKVEKEETIAGATGTVGTAAGIGFAAVGTSASTMTGALATVGGVVGGGMAAGIAITAAAPIIIGATAFGITKLVKRKIRGY